MSAGRRSWPKPRRRLQRKPRKHNRSHSRRELRNDAEFSVRNTIDQIFVMLKHWLVIHSPAPLQPAASCC